MRKIEMSESKALVVEQVIGWGVVVFFACKFLGI